MAQSHESFFSIVCNNIQWSQGSVDPAQSKCTPYCFCGNSRKRTSGLIVRRLIYNVKEGVVVNIENVDIHRMVKFDVVFQIKFKPSGALSIRLARGAMFYQYLQVIYELMLV